MIKEGDIVYVTKYALTSGVFKTEVIKILPNPTNHPNQTIVVKLKSNSGVFFLNKEAFLTEEEAKLDFEKQKENKLKNLRKQLIKLENLEFEIKE